MADLSMVGDSHHGASVSYKDARGVHAQTPPDHHVQKSREVLHNGSRCQEYYYRVD